MADPRTPSKQAAQGCFGLVLGACQWRVPASRSLGGTSWSAPEPPPVSLVEKSCRRPQGRPPPPGDLGHPQGQGCQWLTCLGALVSPESSRASDSEAAQQGFLVAGSELLEDSQVGLGVGKEACPQQRPEEVGMWFWAGAAPSTQPGSTSGVLSRETHQDPVGSRHCRWAQDLPRCLAVLWLGQSSALSKAPWSALGRLGPWAWQWPPESQVNAGLLQHGESSLPTRDRPPSSQH